VCPKQCDQKIEKYHLFSVKKAKISISNKFLNIKISTTNGGLKLLILVENIKYLLKLKVAQNVNIFGYFVQNVDLSLQNVTQVAHFCPIWPHWPKCQ
jgi:hypothetical protein